MALPPNPLIGGYVYNWYECQFSFDATRVQGVLSVSGAKVKIEKVPQFGTDRKPIDIASGRVDIDPITVAMYEFEWAKVKTMLTAKSLGRGYGLVDFMFTMMALGNPLKGAPPVGTVYSGCEISEVGRELTQGPDGLVRDITFQPLRERDLDGQSMVNF